MKNILILLLIINTSVFSQELISSNPSFTKELASWQFGVASYVDDTPDAEFQVVGDGQDGDDSACRIKVKLNTDSGNYNDAYLMHRGITIKKGKAYRVCFYIKSNTRKDKVMISLGSGNPPDLQILEDREMMFLGDNKWQKISFTFKARKDRSNVNFKDLSLILGFNHRFGTFYVDNFSLQLI